MNRIANIENQLYSTQLDTITKTSVEELMKKEQNQIQLNKSSAEKDQDNDKDKSKKAVSFANRNSSIGSI